MAKMNKRKESAKRLAARLERVRKVISLDEANAKAYRAELLDAEDPTGLDEMFNDKYEYDFDPDEPEIETVPEWVPVPFGSFGWLAKDKTVSVIAMNDWINRMVNDRSNHIAARRVRLTTIDEAEISTVFLGINAGRPPAKPIWFESFVMGGELDGHKELYMTWAEAEAGHDTIVGMIRLANEQRQKVVPRIERTRRDNRVR